MKLLDGLLMTVSEFMQWYDQASKRLDAIEKKIEIAEQLCKSVPPLNYIGRIIISYTDDTEQKVIANYGGKSWRRIENFLRGVGANDPNNIPGQKTGEEFVALRESNIPIHSHTETLSTEESQITTQQQEWMAKNKGGNAKIVNTTLASSDTRNAVKIENTNRNYQISPLEYPSKEANEITLPHDNLPPYMKMYIWECTELTDEERRITGEPKDNKCVITWLYNGGKVGSASSTTQQRTIGGNHSSIPTPTYANHDFLGWKDMSGQIKTNE
jgi:microcystin-dependent protein